MSEETKPPAVPEPIALLAADTGEIMGYACGVCRNLMSQGHAMGGYEPNDPKRRLDRESAASCCLCACGALADMTTWDRQCAACREKERPEREARDVEAEEREEAEAETFASQLTAILAQWNPETMWPLTITTGRDGLDFVAFPLELDEVPRDVCERADAARWLCANDGAPFGMGKTAREALDDLLKHAAEIRGKAKGC